MNSELESFVKARARECCEYCQLSQDVHNIDFEIDHIVAKKHGGTTTEPNLALACFSCNSYKGPNIAGIDPASGQLTRLFHPRVDRWMDHFRWAGAELIGLTNVGRTTVRVLAINHPDHIALREELMAEGVFPPTILK